MFNIHREQLLSDPRIDPAAIDRVVHIRDFDAELTAKVFGYKTVGSYYRHASSIEKLLNVHVPLLVIHAKDDPIACDEAAPYDECQANPWTFMVATSGGGHIGWFEWNGGRWFPKPIMAFFKKMVDEVVGVEEPREESEKAKEDDESEDGVVVENGSA